MFKEQLQVELTGTVKVKSIEKFNNEDANVLLYVSHSIHGLVPCTQCKHGHRNNGFASTFHFKFQRAKIEELRKQWHSAICHGFNRDLKSLRIQSHCQGRRLISIIPYLRLLTVEKYAEILLDEVRTLAEGSETFSQSLKVLYSQIGRKVQER